MGKIAIRKRDAGSAGVGRNLGAAKGVPEDVLVGTGRRPAQRLFRARGVQDVGLVGDLELFGVQKRQAHRIQQSQRRLNGRSRRGNKDRA